MVFRYNAAFAITQRKAPPCGGDCALWKMQQGCRRSRASRGRGDAFWYNPGMAGCDFSSPRHAPRSLRSGPIPLKCVQRPVPTSVLQSNLPGLDLIHRGKVRDVYALSAQELLIVATDRLSAFDVVLPDPIPGKGEMLCQMSNFWFARTAHLQTNHLTGKICRRSAARGCRCEFVYPAQRGDEAA